MIKTVEKGFGQTKLQRNASRVNLAARNVKLDIKISVHNVKMNCTCITKSVLHSVPIHFLLTKKHRNAKRAMIDV